MDKKEASKLATAVAKECLGFRVRVLNRVVTNIFDHALKPLDLSLAQGNILMMLALHEQTSPKDIGKVLMMEKSTVSRNLEGRGSNYSTHKRAICNLDSEPQDDCQNAHRETGILIPPIFEVPGGRTTSLPGGSSSNQLQDFTARDASGEEAALLLARD